MTLAALDDMAACRRRLQHGSRTFLAASYLLPRSVRDPACALYAFCRQADDEVDQQVDGHNSPAVAGMLRSDEAVAALRRRLAHVYAGTPGPHSADRALAWVVQQFAIPQALPLALIEGFEWDAQERRYDTLADLHDYAARVAGSVGAMMSLLMGVRSESGLARACDLGVAMQLSNIARDVGEDARQGRLYLPRDWLREVGIDPDDWLARPRHSPALAIVVQRLLDAADALYHRVDAGIAELPGPCRPGIHAARTLYAAIGHQVARNGLDPLAGRASVPGPRKARLLVQATVRARLGPAFDTVARAEPPLAATRYLVDAAAGTLAPPAAPTGLEARALWLYDLFDRLARMDSASAARRLQT
ncbi:phytoene/squalene synthase family protein [Ideonella sp. A 288]|uniref:phytoene/squalene synthase family protein n=1 Tax=Ideonella sp. A 288 TaxID=1962181 RepID=UPI0018FE0D86|nr:phytoene/squalene synthase family protein [Ideonella sp. A 288]